MHNKKILVTGGTGFVGKALAKKLHSLGVSVTTISRTKPQDLIDIGISHICCDLADDNYTEKLPQNSPGFDTIFHTAAYIKMWGAYQDFYNCNVKGTKNLIEYAKKTAVKNFIYTSSPSVIADGTNLKNVDETYPYPKTFTSFYPQTKSIAEKFVLDSNSDKLRTISLRPHLIFGENDNNLIPTIIKKALEGSLLIVGSGQNMVDVTYIEDCVTAHILADQALDKSDYNSSGKAYFISQGEPVLMWQWINQLLELAKVPLITKKINKNLAYTIASLLEKISFITKKEPRLTKFLVSEMSTDHYFSIEAAKKYLGYTPSISTSAALVRTFQRDDFSRVSGSRVSRMDS